MAYREMELTLLSARDLKSVNLFTRMNVYAVASISGDPMTRQVTPTDTSGGRNPSWNATVRFSVPPSASAAAAAPGGGGWLHVLLRSERALGDRDIGEVVVPLAELLAGADGTGPQPPRLASYQVHTVHRGEPRGVLNVSYRFGPVVAPVVERSEDKPPVIAYPAPQQPFKPQNPAAPQQPYQYPASPQQPFKPQIPAAPPQPYQYPASPPQPFQPQNPAAAPPQPFKPQNPAAPPQPYRYPSPHDAYTSPPPPRHETYTPQPQPYHPPRDVYASPAAGNTPSSKAYASPPPPQHDAYAPPQPKPYHPPRHDAYAPSPQPYRSTPTRDAYTPPPRPRHEEEAPPLSPSNGSKSNGYGPTNYYMGPHTQIILGGGAPAAAPTQPRSDTTTAVAAKADDGPRPKPSYTPTRPNASPAKTDNSWPKQHHDYTPTRPNASPGKTDNSWPKHHHDTATWPNASPKTAQQQVDTKVTELARTYSNTGTGNTDHPTKPKSLQEQSNNNIVSARKTQVEEYASVQSNIQPGKADSTTRPKEAYGNARSNSTPPRKTDHHQAGHKAVPERVHSVPTATAR